MKEGPIFAFNTIPQPKHGNDMPLKRGAIQGKEFKMIGIFNPNTQDIKMFETVEQLFKHITTLENEKMLEDHKYFVETQWSFKIMSVRDVRELYTHAKKDEHTKALCEAYKQELPLLEICHGDFTNPACFPLAPDTDLESLKMDWCRAYCKVHGFYLVEKD